MSLSVLSAYVTRLPALEAGESLLSVERVSIGTGSMEKSVRQQVYAEWQREAQEGQRPRRAPSRDASVAELREMGIAVEVVD